MTDQPSAGEQEKSLRTKLIDSLFESSTATIKSRYTWEAYARQVDVLMPILTAATADAKLAGELAMREAVLKAASAWEYGDDWPEGQRLVERIKRDIAALPLTPDSAGVLERIKSQWFQMGGHLYDPIKPEMDLERIKRVERARGAEWAYRTTAKVCRLGLVGEVSVHEGLELAKQFDGWAAEQAAIADGNEDEDES